MTEPGELLAERYEVHSPLGAGGAAETWLAEEHVSEHGYGRVVQHGQVPLTLHALSARDASRLRQLLNG